ncbi:hypothetical protein SFC65_27810 [Priestia filamentosa]|uniref:hypothetical protein n=1 Tax=Priestia filamentosa TaxID=1402861 RepID=UPI003981F672
MNLLSNKKLLYLLSFIATIIFSIIPGIGMKIDGTYRFFGFPAQWLGYYGDGQFSFEVFGLLLNFLVFSFFLILLNKILKKILEI